MGRPIKNSCDYFPHDQGMRNHKKIKALRNKFGISGYAIWVMLLETLTGSDGNVFEDSVIEIELLSGDFGVTCEEIRQVLDYCYVLELLFLKDGFVSSYSLDERLLPVYTKRKLNKNLSAKQNRILGKFSSNDASIGVSDIRNTHIDGIVVTEIPQSKVNKIKVNNVVVVDTATATTEVLNLDTQLPEPNRAVLAGQMTLEECANKAYKETGLQLCEELRLTAQNSPDYDKLRVSIQKFVSHLKSEFKSHYEPREFNRHFKAWYRKRPNDDFNPPKQQKTKEDYERESQEFLKNLK